MGVHMICMNSSWILAKQSIAINHLFRTPCYGLMANIMFVHRSKYDCEELQNDAFNCCCFHIKPVRPWSDTASQILKQPVSYAVHLFVFSHFLPRIALQYDIICFLNASGSPSNVIRVKLVFSQIPKLQLDHRRSSWSSNLNFFLHQCLLKRSSQLKVDFIFSLLLHQKVYRKIERGQSIDW